MAFAASTVGKGGASERPTFPSLPPLTNPRVSQPLAPWLKQLVRSRGIPRWRPWIPSVAEWKVACASVVTAAAVGFAVGRSSVPAGKPVVLAGAPSCAPASLAVDDAHSTADHGDKPQVAPAEATSSGPAAALLASSTAVADAAEALATEKAIARAMARGAGRITSCHGPASPTGTARVSVTFLPTGDVKAVTLRGAQFVGTYEGECLAGKFRSLKVPPFNGDSVTVHKVLTIE